MINLATSFLQSRSAGLLRVSVVTLNLDRLAVVAAGSFFCHLGTLLNAMHDFCRGADFRMRGIGLRRLETGQDGVRFCFKTRDLAEAFQARFGGEMQPEVVRLRKG
jgi:hypothetical protein